MELCGFNLTWTLIKSAVLHSCVLLLSCLLGFGSYFCYDSPAALQSDLKQALNLTQSEYMGLYAWYSWPNVFLCFVGGYLIDAVLGRRLGGMIFSFFVLAGQMLLAYGVSINSLFTMNIGRLVFGLGGETLAVVGNAYSVAWFSGSMLNLAFGMVLSVSRLGSTASLNALAPLFHHLNETAPASEPEYKVLGDTLFIAAATCVASFVIALTLAIIDKQCKPNLDDSDDSENDALVIPEDEAILATVNELLDGDDEPLLGDENAASGPSGWAKIYDGMGEILDFPLGAWLIFGICVFYYSSVFPLISQGVEFFEKWFGVSPAHARALNSVVYTISLPASPLFGVIIDRTKNNVVWVFVAILLTTTAHALMACVKWIHLTPWIPVILMGLGYSMLACSLWPMVSYIVPHNKLGTAYGFMQAIQNLGLALTAMLSGVIVDRGGYMELLMFFLSFQFIAMLCILVLWRRHGPNCEVFPTYVPLESRRASVASRQE